MSDSDSDDAGVMLSSAPGSPRTPTTRLPATPAQTVQLPAQFFLASESNTPAPIVAIHTDPQAQAGAGHQDYIQYATWIASRFGINQQRDQVALTEFAQLQDPQKALIFIAAKVIAMELRLNTMEPASTGYQMSDALKGHIETVTLQVFLDPKLGAYKDQWPNKKALAVLKKNPQWGVTSAVANDKAKMKVIKQKISSRFIHHRNDAKDVIAASLGTFHEENGKFEGTSIGIVELCQQLIRAVGGRSFDLEVTVPLCARAAFIRKSYKKAFKEAGNVKPTDFWGKVDQDLKTVRDEKENDPARISKVMSKILNNDREKYGQLPPEALDHLPRVAQEFAGMNDD
ncbi:hypothetical protein K435DRAFT_859152 [Dendrothele bispora CBS 962.96]|uniref:Uncharacterized protein n=1 Tax=Dendrothele bispora (strain CBS 962.96) TaxID=1314807 RepID=A0A4S8M163_DENBC|nr:hypothetical protein K435DRAFT_859152 [Dendrothele bispora CBS 962.96]